MCAVGMLRQTSKRCCSIAGRGGNNTETIMATDLYTRRSLASVITAATLRLSSKYIQYLHMRKRSLQRIKESVHATGHVIDGAEFSKTLGCGTYAVGPLVSRIT